MGVGIFLDAVEKAKEEEEEEEEGFAGFVEGRSLLINFFLRSLSSCHLKSETFSRIGRLFSSGGGAYDSEEFWGAGLMGPLVTKLVTELRDGGEGGNDVVKLLEENMEYLSEVFFGDALNGNGNGNGGRNGGRTSEQLREELIKHYGKGKVKGRGGGGGRRERRGRTPTPPPPPPPPPGPP